MIRIFEKELASIEKQIEELIAKDDKMAAQNAQMQSINGIGTTISWAILAYLGEITALSRNQLVALAGVAPYNRDSGKYKGKEESKEDAPRSANASIWAHSAPQYTILT